MSGSRHALKVAPSATTDLPESGDVAARHSLKSEVSRLKSRIRDLEIRLDDLNAEHSNLERQKGEVESQPIDTPEAIHALKLQISDVESSISTHEQAVSHNFTELAKVNALINAQEAPRARLAESRSQTTALQQRLNQVNSQIAETQRQITAGLSNIADWRRKRTTLEGCAWLEEKKDLQAEMAEFRRAIAVARKETESVNLKIDSLIQKRDSIVPIWERWRGQLKSRPVPVQSLDSLIEEIERQRRKPVKDTADLQAKLQWHMEENERLREEIRDEKRKNLARGRKMQQMVADMNRQIAQAYEQSKWEEERIITLINSSMKIEAQRADSD